MPGLGDQLTSLLTNEPPPVSQGTGLLAIDGLVEELNKAHISAIKCQKPRRPRPSPYLVPSKRLLTHNSPTRPAKAMPLSDSPQEAPFEELRALLEKGSLIYEAVKRIRLEKNQGKEPIPGGCTACKEDPPFCICSDESSSLSEA